MPGRKFSSANQYRYGFNGKENDNDVKSEGNQQDYGMRIYDTRLGRFLSVDPLTPKYPELTPYQFASNRPIDGIDQDGLEFFPSTLFKPALPIIMLPTKSDAKLISDVAKANPNAGMLKLAFKYSWISAKNKIHLGLDVIGLIPGAGEVADAVNGGLYFLELDYENATYSFASTMPFLGIASTTTKWAKNVLKYSDNAFHSAGGLIFKQGSKHGNRLSHVMKHTVNDLTKVKHGVFDVPNEGLVKTLDEAWEMIQKKGDNVVQEIQKDGRIKYVVDMGKRVGFEGGAKGSNEALNKIQIVVEKESKGEVVTAFPVK